MWIVRLAFAGPSTAAWSPSPCGRTSAPPTSRGGQYAQGLTDFLTVLVAEQSVFTSQDTLAQTQRDVALELVAIYKAVGGGWEVAGAVPASNEG